MKIKIGQIISVKHIGDDNKSYIHPFLVINITLKNIYGIQCSSVKRDDNESYFSRNGKKYYELKYSDNKYISHVSLERFDFIDSDNIVKMLWEPNWKDYNRVAQELLMKKWDNNEILNNNTIHQHVWSGIKKFGESWDV